VPIHTAAWVLGIIAVLFIVLFTLSTMVRPAGAPTADGVASVELAAEVPYPVRAGSEFTVDLVARNVGRRTTGPLRLAIPVDFLKQFPLKGMEPAPTAQQAGRGQRWFVYPSLRAGEWLRIRLRLAAPGPGDYELRARLAGPSAQSRQPIRAPIRVAAR
jgi:hypothetical protein